MFSNKLKPAPILHNNFLVKPNSLSLITHQELKIPEVYCPGCERRSASCLDCRYLANETSPIDQANLSILRNSIKLLVDPKDSTKKILEVDYQFSISPFIAFRPELSNSNLGKATTLALYKRLKKNNLIKEFHDKMTEGIQLGHSTYMTPEKRAELDKLPRYYCSLNYVHKNSSMTKKIRPTSTNLGALIYSQ